MIMKTNSFPEMILSLVVMISVLMPAWTFAAQKQGDNPYIPQTLVKIELDTLIQFGELVTKYDKNCESLTEQAKPDGSRLKQCLTVAKSIRDKFSSFAQAGESFSSKIKNDGKWTKELDEDFRQNAVKRGVDAKFADFVEQNNGFRSFYQKVLSAAVQSKSELDEEIKTLENLQSKSASLQNREDAPVMFVRASSAKFPTPFIAKKWKCLAVYTVIAAASVATSNLGGALVAAGAAVACDGLL